MFISKRECLALAIVCVLASSATTQGTRKDQYGDLLPPDATARIGTVRLRPGWGGSRVAISPDDKLLVTFAERRPLQVWDARTGELLRAIETLENTYRVNAGDMELVRMREDAIAVAFAADSRPSRSCSLSPCRSTTPRQGEKFAP